MMQHFIKVVLLADFVFCFFVPTIVDNFPWHENVYLSLDSHTHKKKNSCHLDSWDAEGGGLREHQAGVNFTVSLKSCLTE